MSADVPNALMQTPLDTEDGDERAVMKIAGVSVDVLLNNDPDLCGGFAVHENGRKVPCVEVSRATCGVPVSAMPWRKKFRGDLEKEESAFNPCDPCAANRVVRGHQQTTRFHVDDVMSSHIDAKVNDEFEEWSNEMHGECGEVKSARGNKHGCLGMTFTCGFAKGEVKVDMVDCVKSMFEEFPIKFEKKKDNDKTITLSTTETFGEDTSKKLAESERETVSQICCKRIVCKQNERGRQDMQPVVSVLCARVKNPGQSCWSKPVRMMKFSSETCDDVSTSSAIWGWHDVEWCIDASFAVHLNFKSHTGACQAFEGGKGTTQIVSAKQKPNTSNSTASELVGADQVLPLMLWTPLFLESQEHPAQSNKVHQDNKSTMLPENKQWQSWFW